LTNLKLNAIIQIYTCKIENIGKIFAILLILMPAFIIES